MPPTVFNVINNYQVERYKEISMGTKSNIDKLNHKGLYYLGIAGFFVLLSAMVFSVYYASDKIDYIWHWNRTAKYFINEDVVQIKAEIEGEAKSITKSSTGISIIISDGNISETYTLPADGKLMIDKGDYMYQGDTLGSYEETKPGLLLIGLWITIKISFISTILGIILGIICGIARLSSNPFFRWTAITYVEIIRGSPLLVQIFIWYFAIGYLVNSFLANVGLYQIPNFWYGVASLAFFTGAYVGEIVRGGIQSIHKGQTEAARSLGMSYAQCMMYVIMPQAMKRILPPLAGQFINLIKDSSLLGMISIRELTKATREIITTTLSPFEFYFICALLYLAVTFPLSTLLQKLENKDNDK